MASAVKKLYPETKLGIGPSIEDGFYYDLDIPGGIKEEDLGKIEDQMRAEIKENTPFTKEVWDKAKAKDHFAARGERYKLELIDELPGDEVSIYKHDNFIDLCRGPHVASTGTAKHFKLLHTSGAYWRGNEKNAQLVRIYGTVFLKKEELATYLERLKEAKKRDHRILGKALELFDIYHNEAGAGLVFYLPKGATTRRIIEDWLVEEHRKRGYQLVITPHVMEKNLWQKSGHLEYYQEYMYPIAKEHQEFILKPMNCPGHILIYKSKVRSWRELPLRLFELGTVYRYEKSGVLCGLLRVRGFTQDDAHIFCQEEDLFSEIKAVLDFVRDGMGKFGFDKFEAELSTRPEKFIGEKSDWDLAEGVLEKVLEEGGFDYRINEGDGAFYGPKIDIKLEDVLGRKWQCATIQVDYNLPKRFDLVYQAKDGERKKPIMVHRVILGSMERFFATLIEHYGGRFPLWLAPVQVSVIKVKEPQGQYAQGVVNELQKRGFRAEADLSRESLPKKIRTKEVEKVPYLLIVGQKEETDNTVSVRKSGKQDLGTMTVDAFLELLEKEVSH